MQFSLTENVMITLKVRKTSMTFKSTITKHLLLQDPNKKGVYLDYLLIIPSDLYNERILEEDTLDRTGEFVSTCGKNDFNIDTSEEGFCRDSVFSITAAHNNGALPCQCDFDGSLSFKCDKFGGQCLCKPNVIGRTCEACKTGYYGFPDCKPCNCPSTAVCEANTGKKIEFPDASFISFKLSKHFLVNYVLCNICVFFNQIPFSDGKQKQIYRPKSLFCLK